MPTKTLHARNRSEWRTWLERHHNKEQEILLVYYKKHTKKPSISYIESVEEALCFGWIDGLKKRIDDERYSHRFTPRKTKSQWSPLNIKIAKQMIKEGKMSKDGLAVYKQRITYDKKFLKSRSSGKITGTPEIEKELKTNKKAWNNFSNLAPSYRKEYILWLLDAKKKETMQKRLREAIKLLEMNQKLGMK